MQVYRDDGVVLRTHKLGEADRIITVLCRQNGRVRAVAKGVRRTKSRFGARLEPFTHVDLLIHPGRSLDAISQAEVIRAYGPPLAADYPKYTAGAAMLETAERLTPVEKEPAIRQFLLLIGGLRALVESVPSASQGGFAAPNSQGGFAAPASQGGFAAPSTPLRGETPLIPPFPGEPGTTRRAPGLPAYRAGEDPTDLLAYGAGEDPTDLLAYGAGEDLPVDFPGEEIPPGELEREPRMVLDAYLLRSLAVAGYAPALEECARCGRSGVASANGGAVRLTAFAVGAGGMVCESCRPAGAASPGPQTVALMIALLRGDWATASRSERRHRVECSGLVAAYLQWHLEHSIRSLRHVERA